MKTTEDLMVEFMESELRWQKAITRILTQVMFALLSVALGMVLVALELRWVINQVRALHG